ncbi:MAG TPA: hypothetical protein VK760_13380 [Candidatus Acidoferrales bacterium]|jgi:hypothetical protein|nr:hypothetical protein [Candidatus Acidoferrales bacterium]
MNADADYARVVDLLTKQKLAPYVAYVTRDRISGLAHDGEDGRIVVRTSDGKIVSGKQHVDVNVANSSFSGLDSNPVSQPVFAPHCYRATGETPATLDGSAVLKLTLTATCGSYHDYPFTTLYVDPQTYRPLEVSGIATPGDGDSKSVTVALDERYAGFDGRWMPVSLNVDVTGSGVMFWLQVHLREIYSAYEFRSNP